MHAVERIALQDSISWAEECGNLIEDVNFPYSSRARISAALFHLCIEHHSGINALTHNDLYASALALRRPQLDSYLRGSWILNCATEEQIELFLSGKDPPHVDTMIKLLETQENFAGGILGKIKTNLWRSLCDFTHGGMLQVTARSTLTEIQLSHKPEQTVQTLGMSSILSLLACVGIAEIAKSDKLANDARDKYQSIYGGAITPR